MHERPDQPTSNLEEALRGSAPMLPASLKSRTMAKCASQVAAKREKERRVNRYLSWGIAGILMTQWLTISLIEGQTNQLMGGSLSKPTLTSITVAQAVEILQHRTRELALLVGQPSPSPK